MPIRDITLISKTTNQSTWKPSTILGPLHPLMHCYDVTKNSWWPSYWKSLWWWTAAILKIVKSQYQRKIIQFQWNLVCIQHLVHNSRFGTWWQSHYQVWTFLKFKLADNSHIENHVWPYSATDCLVSVKFCVGCKVAWQ